jgi:hypothetical protein
MIMKYIVPTLYSQDFSHSLTSISQYLLDGQQLSVIDGHNFCGQAIDDSAAELCLTGSEDISTKLAGLTLNSTVAGSVTILSCTASSNSACEGLLYQCILTQSEFEIPQCITSISNGDETISCSSSDCTPDA